MPQGAWLRAGRPGFDHRCRKSVLFFTPLWPDWSWGHLASSKMSIGSFLRVNTAEHRAMCLSIEKYLEKWFFYKEQLKCALWEEWFKLLNCFAVNLVNCYLWDKKSLKILKTTKLRYSFSVEIKQRVDIKSADPYYGYFFRLIRCKSVCRYAFLYFTINILVYFSLLSCIMIAELLKNKYFFKLL